MFSLLQNILAFFRGAIVTGVACFTGNKKVHIGKALRIYKGSVLRRRSKATIIIGDHVKIDADAILSALNGGKLTIGNNVGIGRRNMIVCHEKITIGDNTILAPNVLIYDHDHVFSKEEGVKQREYKTKAVVIGNNCWIGAGTIILKGTIIGDNCIVGAGCVLKGSFESGSVIIQKRETIELK